MDKKLEYEARFIMPMGTVKDCPIKGFKQVQINNLKIRWNSTYGKFMVISPDGTPLEEWDLLSDAKRWASATHDFIQPKAKPKGRK
jgi:hypothetical protein